MLFCPSFTQSERFLQTDQLIIRLQVVVVTNFIRMLVTNVSVNVFKSDAVTWWAAIFHTPSSMFDKLLHLSKSKSFAMSCSRSRNFCEAVGNLLTVTMYLLYSLSRFHRPGLHEIDLRVHVASASARTLAFHKSQTGPWQGSTKVPRQNEAQDLWHGLKTALFIATGPRVLFPHSIRSVENYTAFVPHESHTTHSATISASTDPDRRPTDLVLKEHEDHRETIRSRDGKDAGTRTHTVFLCSNLVHYYMMI